MTAQSHPSAQSAERQYALLRTRVAAAAAANGGVPLEDHLRAPVQSLIEAIAEDLGYPNLVLAGEIAGAVGGARPDYTVTRGGLVIGHIELKSPGAGVDPDQFGGHNLEQYRQLRRLPNLLYTDGIDWILWQNGKQVARATAHGLPGQGIAGASIDTTELVRVLDAFCAIAPQAPSTARELAATAARLCRVMRNQVLGALEAGGSRDLATVADEWRMLLFPEASDAEFADAYAQTITFGLIAARAAGASLVADGSVARRVAQATTALDADIGLIPTALKVLCADSAIVQIEPAVESLLALLAVTDPGLLNDAGDWLYFYEDFLAQYDPDLRKESGSYYTPAGLVEFMVRLVDEVLVTRLGQTSGFAGEEVTVVDPAVGTGTFLLQIIDRIASTVEQRDGIGAVAGALRIAADRLVGFELQTGPYSVAQFRTGARFRRHGVDRAPRVLLADTLADPYTEEVRLGSIYEPISRERRTANRLKTTSPVMVAIGNPPYRERAKGLGGWVENGNPDAKQPSILDDWKPPADWGVSAYVANMSNLLVYFWRWATWKVLESAGNGEGQSPGIVCFVTTSAWLGGAGFQMMRAWLRQWCSEIWVVSLTPEGHQPDVATRMFEQVQHEIAVVCAVRSPDTDETPAAVWFTEVSPGTRDEKLAELKTVGLAGEMAGTWTRCPTAMRAPFKPAGAASWRSCPSIEDLLPWSSPGVLANRGWPTSPDSTTLEARWQALTNEPDPDKKQKLLKKTRDRNIDRIFADNLPQCHGTTDTPLRLETAPCPAPVRLAMRSFDRQWVVPDIRVLDMPRPPLWQARSDRQVHLTCVLNDHPENGPAVTFTQFLPSLHHYHGRGGRTFPLWRDDAASAPNITPGLLGYLIQLLETEIQPEDVLAYVAGVSAHPAYTSWLNRVSPHTPGLRIPLTADRDYWSMAVDAGRRVVWAHTFGERYVNAGDHRPPGPIRKSDGPRLRSETGEGTHNRTFEYNDADRELRIGTGVFENVSPAVHGYEVSGKNVIRTWFNYRRTSTHSADPASLESITPDGWRPEWDIELLDVLNSLAVLVDLEPEQAELLTAITDAPQVTVDDLTAAAVLPVPSEAERAPSVSKKASPSQSTLV